MLGKSKSKSQPHMWGFFYIPRITRETGIFVTDEGGYIFSEFFKMLASEKGMELPPLVLEHPDNAANEYIRNYDMVVVLRNPSGTIICYSVNYRNRLPLPFTDRLKAYAQVVPDSTVLWSDDVFKEPQEAPAREVVYGQRPEKPPKQPTKAEMRKKWAHPEELTQRELDYLSGKTEEPPGQ